MNPMDEQLHKLLVSLTNHSPDAAQIARIESLREQVKEVVFALDELVPQRSRERSVAITHLEDFTMWAVKAIIMERFNG